MTRSELIKILRIPKRHRNPEITFWIDDDVELELERCGEFGITPEITIGFKILGRLWSKESPKAVKRSILRKARKKKSSSRARHD